jgi:outer membrane receptor protein involved in Fe transport
LNPEITWSYNLGADVQLLPSLDANVNLYHTDTRDRIALNPNEDYAAYNLDRAFTQGVEVGLTYTWKMLRQKLDYTYLQAEGQDNETGVSTYEPLAFCPKHKIDYLVDVSLPWRSAVTFDVLYVSKQFTDIGEGGVELPDYAVANLRVSKKIGWAELYVACNNLLDRHYAETADIFNGYFPQPARNYMGGMTVRFMK